MAILGLFIIFMTVVPTGSDNCLISNCKNNKNKRMKKTKTPFLKELIQDPKLRFLIIVCFMLMLFLLVTVYLTWDLSPFPPLPPLPPQLDYAELRRTYPDAVDFLESGKPVTREEWDLAVTFLSGYFPPETWEEIDAAYACREAWTSYSMGGIGVRNALVLNGFNWDIIFLENNWMSLMEEAMQNKTDS